MEVLYPRCCGLDVHKKSVSACISIKESAVAEKHHRRFGTHTAELLELAAWLREHGVTHVAMEATGVYWKPVWNLLEGQFALLLANPYHVKAIAGKKTDRQDGERITDLLQHGLLQGSFVPTSEIRQLRDLTRSRASLVQERARIANRIQKVLEDGNVKLGSVASDVLGVSGRQMLQAIVAGETDAEKLAERACGKLRQKIPQLRLALRGRVSDHQRFLLREWLETLEFLEGKIRTFEEEIRKQVLPFAAVVKAWMRIPGVQETTAWSLVAEMGPDMNQFGSAEQAASWACVCPGNKESAGKRLSGKTRPGNPWLRRTLCEAAWGAARKKNSYFQAQFHRLRVRRGPQRALIAVAHSLLVTGYHVLQRGTAYQDLGGQFFLRQDQERTKRTCIRKLEKLGYKVTVETPVAA